MVEVNSIWIVTPPTPGFTGNIPTNAVTILLSLIWRQPGLRFVRYSLVGWQLARQGESHVVTGHPAPDRDGCGAPCQKKHLGCKEKASPALGPWPYTWFNTWSIPGPILGVCKREWAVRRARTSASEKSLSMISRSSTGSIGKRTHIVVQPLHRT